MDAFQYKPEVDYSLISAENSAVAIKYLNEFKKGMLSPLEGHLLTAENLRKYLGSNEVPPDVRGEFRSKSKEIEDTLTAINRCYSSIETELNQRQLETIANREYFNHFNDQTIDHKKLEYIKLLKSYEYLKIANLTFIENWDKIIRIFKSMVATPANKPILEQVLRYRAFARREVCDQTSLYLRRLAYALKIQNEQNKFGKIIAQGFYTSLLDYKPTIVFREDLETIVGSIGPTQAKKEEKPIATKSGPESCMTDAHHLDSSGVEGFNQGFAYLLQTDEKKLELDEKKIQKAIYIETHLGAEETALRQDIIRKFISHARSQNRVKEYNDFLNGYFNFIQDTIFIQFTNLNEKEKMLLMYHFGIVFFLKIVVHYLRETKTGFVHRHLTRSKMLRELPFEYIKHTLMLWWDKQIFQKLLSTERNNRDLYLELVEDLHQNWNQSRQAVLTRIKNDVVLFRAYSLHDVTSLQPFLIHELSYVIHVFFTRFLGHDYIFLPPNKKVRI